MKKLNKRSKSNEKGFTLVELLIVIALLGALIAGILISLDPLEQTRRGQDTALRNTASEFFNALNRYYATKGTFPWGNNTTFSGQTLNSRMSDINTLIDSGELKTNFMQRAGSHVNKIYITSNTPTDLSVCFQPISKSMQKDPLTIYDMNGSSENASSCKSQTTGSSGTNCYMCLR